MVWLQRQFNQWSVYEKLIIKTLFLDFALSMWIKYERYIKKNIKERPSFVFQIVCMAIIL